jgi:phage FluMu protein Com
MAEARPVRRNSKGVAHEWRCANCGRLLCRFSVHHGRIWLEIRCERCGDMNDVAFGVVGVESKADEPAQPAAKPTEAQRSPT